MSVAMTDAGTGLGRAKRYAVLAYGAFGTMADVGMMVAGSVLVGLAVSVLLAGFDLVPTDIELSTGAMMVSALVIGVSGAFFLGLAAEGPLGRGRRLVGFETWEVGAGRIIAVFVVGLVAYLLHGVLVDVLAEFPEPLLKANEVLRAVGVTGMIAMPLVGVPLTMALRMAPWDHAWLKRADMPVMFVVWAVATLIVL